MKLTSHVRGAVQATLLFAAGVLAFLPPVARGSDAGTRSALSIEPEPVGFLIRTNYHGWTNSILVSNGRVEAIIVPAIGRVMQFRFAGEPDGPFWENEALFGKSPDPQANEWGNFGGDKTWPAPQTDWSRTTPRSWPPPVAFDSMPVEAIVDGFEVTLVSPVDPYYGIRTRRDIRLALDAPVMTITTTYEKVSGPTKRLGIWVITQLKHPVAVYAPLPEHSRFLGGYNRQSDEPPMELKVQDGLLSLMRDPKAAHKIGTDTSSLFWVGSNAVVRIDSPRLFGREYPDQGSSAEIYTNPDPLPYVELEMLGPLHIMKIGEKVERLMIYTLLRRVETDPDLEVHRVLAR